MKLAVTFVLILFSNLAFCQNPKDSIAIAQLIIDDYKTLGNWNIQKHLQNCSANYTLIENGDIQTLAQEIEYYKKNAHRNIQRIDSFNFRNIRIAGDLAYAIYTLSSKIIENKTSKTLNWSESVICRKLKGEWKLELIHSTPIISK